MPLSFKHIFAVNAVHHAAFLEASVYVYTWHGPNNTGVRKRCLSLRHSGRDAFSEAVIFLPRFVTKYYSLALKITASVYITWTSQTRPRIDGVRKSMAYSTRTRIQ